MSAVAGEAAFEEGEFAHLERFRGEAPGALEEARDFVAAATLPARERDVRVKGAALRLETGGGAGALDPGGERGHRLPRLDSGPKSARTALLEAAGAGDA